MTRSATLSWLKAASDVRGRIRAGLRCALFLLFATASAGLLTYILVVFLHIRLDQPVTGTIESLVVLSVLLMAVLGSTALMAIMTRDRATLFGWGTGDRLRNLAIGAVSGSAITAAMNGLIAVLGGASIHLTSSTPTSVIWHSLEHLIISVLMASIELSLLLGYPLVALSRAISFWPAAAISSAAVVLVSITEQRLFLSEAVSDGLVEILLAFSFWRSGSLWFAVGWLAAGEFSESFVFGRPDRNSIFTGHGSLLVTDIHGPAWLSGGLAGPTASWLTAPALALTAVVIRLALRPSHPDDEPAQSAKPAAEPDLQEQSPPTQAPWSDEERRHRNEELRRGRISLLTGVFSSIGTIAGLFFSVAAFRASTEQGELQLASQRAWLTIKVSPVALSWLQANSRQRDFENNIIGAHANDVAVISALVSIDNIGRSPAFDVSIDVLHGFASRHGGHQPESVFDECHPPGYHTGRMIFPGQRFDFMSPEKSARRDAQDIFLSQPMGDAPLAQLEHVYINMNVCVTYKTTPNGEPHVTVGDFLLLTKDHRSGGDVSDFQAFKAIALPDIWVPGGFGSGN